MSPGRTDRKSPTGRLRIVAGKWRSRLLPIADVSGLRPTPERVRETLFNWLASTIEGSRCLDLFAGSGALGFEALSRGAREVVFVEKSSRAAAALEKCAAVLDATGARILRTDAADYLQSEPLPFDIVFLDPPFGEDLGGDLFRLLNKRGWLSAGAKVYLEQDRERPFPPLPDGWAVLKEKTAGQVRYALVTSNG
ncbi:MAG TPA: 16S rRNA (guanine(966)-N(2))-methyltransferase RsmD [Gammaproteobacteria bacterium]|nr:16S rRNA (guanine(966)-N(2))-methyltransferase RsmD [Gammaproteobacteria bacterium]